MTKENYEKELLSFYYMFNKNPPTPKIFDLIGKFASRLFTNVSKHEGIDHELRVMPASFAVPGSGQEYEKVKEFIKKHDYIIPDDIHIKLGVPGDRAVKYVELFEKEGLLLRNEKEPWQASKVIHDLKLLNNDSCPEA
jgi:hypothetical protein